MTEPPKLPKELEAIADKVLAYRPKPKSKAAKKRKNAVHELRRLPRSRGGLDDQRGVEIVPDARARPRIGELGHGRLRSWTSGRSFAWALTLLVRCSSYGPHTRR